MTNPLPSLEIKHMERHVQTILVSMVTAILLWVGISVTQTRESVARLEEKMSSVNFQINLVSELNDRVYEVERRISVIEARSP